MPLEVTEKTTPKTTVTKPKAGGEIKAKAAETKTAKPAAAAKADKPKKDTSKASKAPRTPVHERITKLEAKIAKANADHASKVGAMTAKLEGMKARHSKLLAVREMAGTSLAEIEAKAAEARETLKLARKAAKLAAK